MSVEKNKRMVQGRATYSIRYRRNGKNLRLSHNEKGEPFVGRDGMHEAQRIDAEIKAGKYAFIYKPKLVEFADAYDAFWEYKELQPNFKEQSYVTQKHASDKHILPFFEEFKDCRNIRPKDIEKWKSSMSGYKYSYQSKIWIALHQLFDFIDDNYNVESPCENIAGFYNTEPPIEYTNYKSVTWTSAEFLKFLAAIDEDKQSLSPTHKKFSNKILWRAYFLTLFATMARKNEISALTWADIDFDRHTIDINKTVTFKTKEALWAVTSPKTKSSYRITEVPAFVVTELKKYKQWQAENFPCTDFVFCGDRPIPETSAQHAFDRYRERAELPKISIHKLRHSGASLLYANNIPNIDLAVMLGHSKHSNVTPTYIHPQSQEKAIEILTNAITTPKNQ